MKEGFQELEFKSEEVKKKNLHMTQFQHILHTIGYFLLL